MPTKTTSEPAGWTEELHLALDRRLREAADPERAAQMSRYMKDRFPFYGVPSPARRAIQRELLKTFPKPGEAELEAIALRSFGADRREHQYFACELVAKHAKRRSAAWLSTLKRLITTKSWWDTVDGLAANGVGPLVRAHPALRREMDRWIRSDNLWLARTAILHQLRYKKETDRELLFRYCERRMADTDFFLRKAIGWALRELSKSDGEAVRDFVAEHEAGLSGLSKREALKWLTERASERA